MARTRQTARKSTGGKAPRKGKGLVYGNTDDDSASRFSLIGIPTPSSLPPNKMEDENDQVEEDSKEFNVDLDSLIESTFYAHYFETGQENVKIFSPRCSFAKVINPLTKAQEHWCSVNFNSKYDGEGIKKFHRNTLNLVVALDISGSMSCNFDCDRSGSSKMKVAKDCLLIILSQLHEDDSFGLIVFNGSATIIQSLTKWKDTDKVKLEKDIMRLRANGGTELVEGLNSAKNLLAKAEEGTNISNRIFFLTDMEVDQGEGREFTKNVKNLSDESKWTTVIGVGMDLTLDIIHDISRTPGANYSNVLSTDDFKSLMDNEFGYLVTPIGFNINLNFSSASLRLESGYGSPEVHSLQPGNPVLISTEFPSAQNDKGERRSGSLLFKLKNYRDSDEDKLSLVVQHEDLAGIVQKDIIDYTFIKDQQEYYQDLGIRKAILLVYYTDLIKDYMAYCKQKAKDGNKNVNYKSKLLDFIKHFESEETIVGDLSLVREMEILQKAYYSEPDVIPEEIHPEQVEQDSTKRKLEDPDDSTSKKARAESTTTSSPVIPVTNEEEDSSSCVICLSNKKNVLLLPCKHLCLCSGCSSTEMTCPLCRSPINSKTTVFV